MLKAPRVSGLSLALILAACGAGRESPPDNQGSDGRSSSPSARSGLYEATATVLETESQPPMLCLGTILESFPPQCGDIPITNWNWEEVEGEERAAGTTWGEFGVLGTFDGESFTVTDAGPPEEPDETANDEDIISTPCPRPPSGWQTPNPARASRRDLDKTAAEARREPDFSGLWIDYIDEPRSEAEAVTAGIILNVAFTGDLEWHDKKLRTTWGGPLCVTKHLRTHRELRRIQDELSEDFGLDLLWSSTDEVNGVVEVGVVAITAETEAALDRRYGAGLVEVESALHPVR